jgi:hypothetical protein
MSQGNSNSNRYYLFKAGRLVGPLTAEKIDEMRANGQINQYSWMMDEQKQVWAPVEAMPKENPFQASLASLKERVLSGAFIHRGIPLTGVVKAIHTYGLEILLETASPGGLNSRVPIRLNLVDETHFKASNAEVLFQNMEKTAQGVLLRFSWKDLPSTL